MPRAIGNVATAATTEVPVNATAYIEPTVGAHRALVSSSVNDAASGTGARTVRVTYYTLASGGKVAGPFVEMVTMNGAAPVAMAALALALVEKLEVVTAGSGGVAAGTISLTLASDGSGGTIASIAVGQVCTRLAHHYVPTGYQCRVTDIAAIGGDPVAAQFAIKTTPYPLAVEQPSQGYFGASNTSPVNVAFPDGEIVTGPARLALYVAPGNANAQASTASFGYVDHKIDPTI